MEIQSLSVVVPNKACVNNCAFCVSKMHCDTYKNQMDDNLPFFDLYLKDYLKRLEFARHNGCNTVMLTGNSEPQQNRKFLTYFGLFQQMMRDPFEWVEMQTTGVMLDANYLRFLRNHVGVNLISLSLSSLKNGENAAIIGSPEKYRVDIPFLCSEITRYDFSLRLSLNLTSSFDQYEGDPCQLFEKCRELGANQVTLRVLYSDNGDSPQSKWIREKKAKDEAVRNICNYVMFAGKPLGRLPYGATKYSLMGLSVVIDDDCMAKKKDVTVDGGDAVKYLILQPDCKLYSQWDDPASLIF